MEFEEIIELYSSALDVLLDTFYVYIGITINYLPGFMPIIGILVAVKLFKHLLKPKYDGPVFDDDYESDFNLAYDSLRRMYDSDADFINDYMSDFTAFQDDEPDLDDLVESDMWENITYDRYIDIETAFVEDSESDFSIYYEDFEGSYSDYVEAEEL